MVKASRSSPKKAHYRDLPEGLSYIPEEVFKHNFEERMPKTDSEALQSQASNPGNFYVFQLDKGGATPGPTEETTIHDQSQNHRFSELERRALPDHSSREFTEQPLPLTDQDSINDQLLDMLSSVTSGGQLFPQDMAGAMPSMPNPSTAFPYYFPTNDYPNSYQNPSSHLYAPVAQYGVDLCHYSNS